MLINWKDVNNRYPETAKVYDASQADSSHVMYAINELESRLGNYFTVPFSENNLTAKDLAIDICFCKVYKYRDQEKAAMVSSDVGGRIDALIKGRANMITTSGDQLMSVGGTVYSTTQNYHPVHGMGPIELSVVDSGEIMDEENARGRFY